MVFDGIFDADRTPTPNTIRCRHEHASFEKSTSAATPSRLSSGEADAQVEAYREHRLMSEKLGPIASPELQLSWEAQSCVCGNIFDEDASFCRICGRPRPKPQAAAPDRPSSWPFVMSPDAAGSDERLREQDCCEEEDVSFGAVGRPFDDACESDAGFSVDISVDSGGIGNDTLLVMLDDLAKEGPGASPSEPRKVLRVEPDLEGSFLKVKAPDELEQIGSHHRCEQSSASTSTSSVLSCCHSVQSSSNGEDAYSTGCTLRRMHAPQDDCTSRLPTCVQEDAGDLALFEAMQDACSSMRERIHREKLMAKELSMRLQQEIQQIRQRGELENQKFDLTLKRLNAHQDTLAEKLGRACALRDEVQGKLLDEATACARMREEVPRQLQCLQAQMVNLDRCIEDERDLQASMKPKAAQVEESKAAIEAELESQLSEVRTLAAETARSIVGRHVVMVCARTSGAVSPERHPGAALRRLREYAARCPRLRDALIAQRRLAERCQLQARRNFELAKQVKVTNALLEDEAKRELFEKKAQLRAVDESRKELVRQLQASQKEVAASKDKLLNEQVLCTRQEESISRTTTEIAEIKGALLHEEAQLLREEQKVRLVQKQADYDRKQLVYEQSQVEELAAKVRSAGCCRRRREGRPAQHSASKNVRSAESKESPKQNTQSSQQATLEGIRVEIS